MEINCKYENNMILYTRCSEDVCVFLLSLPVRGRGLKLLTVLPGQMVRIAACAGTWIEISSSSRATVTRLNRCLRGGVD